MKFPFQFRCGCGEVNYIWQDWFVHFKFDGWKDGLKHFLFTKITWKGF